MAKLFVDTDICIDLLTQRDTHYDSAARLFTQGNKGKLKLYVSALTFNNLNYMLQKHCGNMESRRVLNKFKRMVKVLAVDDKIIDLALNSTFSDFEDAVQYYTAIENGLSILITRNLKDYKKAEIPVFTADMYLNQ